MVAEPDEKARANLACSSAAIAFSKFSLLYISFSCSNVFISCPAYRFGLELLVYSYAPIGLPTPVCAKVVDREI